MSGIAARRRGGPQVIFFGGDDAREEWTWECRFPHREHVQAFNDATTWAEAAQALHEHHRRHHGPRGRHACPRCGNPVQNRTGDPERTDLCPPCTAEVARADVVRLDNLLIAERGVTARLRREVRGLRDRVQAVADWVAARQHQASRESPEVLERAYAAVGRQIGGVLDGKTNENEGA